MRRDMDLVRIEKYKAIESCLARDIRECARWMIENSERIADGSARLGVDEDGTAMTLTVSVGRKVPTVTVNGSYAMIGCDDE